jgi:hypothetical protein
MTEATKAKKAELGRRCVALAVAISELMKIDHTESIYCRESDAMSMLISNVRQYVDAHHMRMETGLRVMETCLDVQEELIAERRSQITNAARH